MAYGKWRAHEIKYLRRVSFAGIAETHVICFLGSDDGKKENSAREGVESRFVFKANQ